MCPQLAPINYGGDSVRVIVYGPHSCVLSTVTEVIRVWRRYQRAIHMCGGACSVFGRLRNNTCAGWLVQGSATFGLIIVRMLRNRLSLASSLGKLSVHGHSKCFCCIDSEVESLEHIFSDGDLARFIWAFFGEAVGVVYRGSGVRAWLAGWWFLPARQSRVESLYTVLPRIICWHIWLARKLALFEGNYLRQQTICDRILADVVDLMLGDQDRFVSCLALYTAISGWRLWYSHTVVRWEQPSQGRCKLNTDGCALGNPETSGGGGVLRESSGMMQCRVRGFSRVHVEMDSQVLALILQGKSRCAWIIRADMEAIQSIVGLDWTVGHCYREANQVADVLAKVGAQGAVFTIYSSQVELPRPARGAMTLDSIGTPVIHVRVVRK
ncbi:uncharacterized protein [Coffea arabica]|uniref:RNase H type-1 domain-containing protein n=1 Tax=Coffea arabica TaxID=13443 RepID=A0ABM4VZ11_COFAR